MNNIVTEIADKDVCSSCGVCVGLCPSHALSMKIQGNGDLALCVDADICLEECHLCLDVCPFSGGVHNPRGKNVELFSAKSDSIYNEDIGWHYRSIVGSRKEASLRQASASGGLATWCMETLLKKQLVTRVAVVRIAENQDRGFFEYFAASSIEKLRSSSGSIYHPVEISGILREIESNKQERWAIVGVPCLCAAIRNSSRLRKQVPFVFGLACGMYQNTFYTEMLLDESGVERGNIKNIEYRRKSDGGTPSDYRFRGTDNRRVGKEVPYRGLPFYLGKNAFFRLNACNYCMDVFAETADACFMDAWLPAYRQESKGTSLVVIRNSEVHELFLQGESDGELQINETGAENVVLSQKGHVRRKRDLIYMRRGIEGPTNTTRAKPATTEKMDWWLQKHAQKRSKSAWARYGRRYGQIAFWIVLLDVLLLQTVTTYIVKTISFPKRLTRKLKSMLS